MKNPRDEHTKPMLSASELERPRAKPKSAILKAQSWPLRLRRKKIHYGISVSKAKMERCVRAYGLETFI
jgi:hypothetical protein